MTTLGPICSFLNGGTPSRGVARYYQGDVPWITGADISGPRADTARSFITEEAIGESATNRVHAGTVLLVTRTSVGKVALAAMELCFSQDITAIIPDPHCLDGSYLVHFLKTKQPHLERLARGATIKGVTREAVANLAIPLPPLDEQKRIAGILDAADALRAKRREALAQLDTLLQSTFLDMFGDPVTNLMGWDAPPLAAFCKTGTGGTPSRGKMQRYYEAGTIPWVKSGELREQVITSTGEYITETALKETSVKLVPKDALLLALYGATVGRLGILGTQATTNQAVCHIIPNSLRADLRYMFHSLSNQVSYLVGRGVGGAQPNISQGIIKSLPIPLPPLDLQHRFATIVKSVEQQKARQRAHLAELDTLFASLQSRAFRGDL